MKSSVSKRVKVTPIYTAYTDEGIEALRLLRMAGHGVSVSDVVNIAVCEKAIRLNDATRKRLDELNEKYDNAEVALLRAQVENLTAQVVALTEIIRELVGNDAAK